MDVSVASHAPSGAQLYMATSLLQSSHMLLRAVLCGVPRIFFVGACKGSAGFPRGVQRGFRGGVGGVPAGFPRGFPRGFRGFPGGSGGFRKVSARYSKILQILASTRKLHKIYNFLYTYATWPFSTRGFPSATESKYYNTIKVFAAIFGVRPGNMSAH